MNRSFSGLVFATVLVAACSAPTATPSASMPSVTASTATSAAPETETPLTGWRLGTIQSVVPARWATPVAVAAGKGQLVAVGRPTYPAGVDEGEMYGTIWTSKDGLAWTAIDLDTTLQVGGGSPTSGPEPGFNDVAYGPGGFVVLGGTMSDLEGTRVGIWRSTTGSTWERVEVPEAVFAAGRPVAVTAGGPGYVMVGAWLDPDAPSDDAAPPRAAVWTSPDGTAWTRVPDQKAFAVGGYIDTGETPDAGGMLAVAATPDGLVAIGRTCKDVNLMEGQIAACRPLLWRSSDGFTWELRDPKVPVHPGDVTDIAAEGDHVVAVGGGWGESSGRYTLRSSDGTTWRWSEEPRVPHFEGVVGAPASFIARWHDGGQVGLATSPDGATWATIEGVPSMPEGPSVRDSDITTMDDRVVVVGWREGEEDPTKAAFALVGPLGAE